jgi:hypothetical protein
VSSLFGQLVNPAQEALDSAPLRPYRGLSRFPSCQVHDDIDRFFSTAPLPRETKVNLAAIEMFNNPCSPRGKFRACIREFLRMIALNL